MNIERDKLLTEAMGLCYHSEWTWHDQTFDDRCEKYECNKCGKIVSYSPSFPHINFSTWEGFGKLWEWLFHITKDGEDYEEWAEFFLFNLQNKFLSLGYKVPLLPFRYINPDEFANEVYQYLKSDDYKILKEKNK